MSGTDRFWFTEDPCFSYGPQTFANWLARWNSPLSKFERAGHFRILPAIACSGEDDPDLTLICRFLLDLIIYEKKKEIYSHSAHLPFKLYAYIDKAHSVLFQTLAFFRLTKSVLRDQTLLPDLLTVFLSPRPAQLALSRDVQGLLRELITVPNIRCHSEADIATMARLRRKHLPQLIECLCHYDQLDTLEELEESGEVIAVMKAIFKQRGRTAEEYAYLGKEDDLDRRLAKLFLFLKGRSAYLKKTEGFISFLQTKRLLRR